MTVLLPTTRGGLLPLARVGSWLFAYALLELVSWLKNESVDESQAVGLTTADFPQLTLLGRDHGRQR